MHVKFKNTKSEVHMINPGIELKGTAWGERTFSLRDLAIIWDLEHNLFL